MYRISDLDDMPSRKSGRSRKIALFLLLATISLALWFFRRDTGRETEKWAVAAGAMTALDDRRSNFSETRNHLEAALAVNYQDWRTHHALAGVLSHFLSDNTGALKHYLYALAYAPEYADVGEITEQTDILQLIRAGLLENPAHAVEDMFLAVEAGTKNLFFDRLSLRLQEAFAACWDGWSKRGRGTVVWQSVIKEQSGAYGARLSVAFPDDRILSVRLRCSIRDRWLLDASFH
ncbi:MAG: hypothetical protein FWG74_01265 [Planctomycetes bacterium]|nr:hypothetical protein [Planctomycetota bacterium]